MCEPWAAAHFPGADCEASVLCTEVRVRATDRKWHGKKTMHLLSVGPHLSSSISPLPLWLPPPPPSDYPPSSSILLSSLLHLTLFPPPLSDSTPSSPIWLSSSLCSPPSTLSAALACNRTPLTSETGQPYISRQSYQSLLSGSQSQLHLLLGDLGRVVHPL